MLVLLKNVLDEEVKIINFIKSGPLSRGLFNMPCDEMGKRCEHSSAVVHQVPWFA